jgi:predicted transcriptional regulator YdeE/peroxiredoxin
LASSFRAGTITDTEGRLEAGTDVPIGRIYYYIYVRRIVFPLGIVSLLLLAGCYGGTRPPRIGKPAPDFVVQDAEHKVTLSQFKGQVVVLNFWASWCPPCVAETPSLVKMQQRMKDKGIVVVAISADEDDSAYHRFISKYGMDFVTVRDPSAKIQHSRNLHHRPQRHPKTQICKCLRLEHARSDGFSQPLVRRSHIFRRFTGPPGSYSFAMESEETRHRRLDSAGRAKMNPAIIEGFTVIGIEARTGNAREMAGTGIIAKQWGRFTGENLLAQIPNRSDGAILAVYSDYEGDKDGEYSFMIGARVKAALGIPAGMIARKVPAGHYAVFTSERGPVEKIVVETWQKIWSATNAELGGQRAYSADFEIYDERARDPKNAQVDIYVAVR